MMRWRPFREMEDVERRVEDMLGRQLWPAVWRRVPRTDDAWAPAMDVYEKDDKFVVKAELPGMKEEDIDISVVGDTVVIKGERRSEQEVKDDDYYCCERSYGQFSRSIAMPSNVDAQKVTASYEDGVLEVTLPKHPEVKPKKISVSAKKKTTKSGTSSQK